MKTCSRCSTAKSLDHFHTDRTRLDGKHPFCNDCRREIYGSVKMPKREKRNCHVCGIEFEPRISQVKNNKSGRFFCSNKHYRQFKRESSTSNYQGYRSYIVERDGFACVVCGSSERLHVHHIITRGAGGTNEYQNLITLCHVCHSTKAHGIDAAEFKAIFQHRNAGLERPLFWDKVMEQSLRDREVIRKKANSIRKRQYQKLKASPKFQAFREEQKQRVKERNKQFREKYGFGYNTYRKRVNRGETITAVPENVPSPNCVHCGRMGLRKKGKWLFCPPCGLYQLIK